MQKPIKFCPNCGASMRLAIPDGDNRKRSVCSACGHIFYQNPRNIVGCIVEYESQILLCKRAIQPRAGFWTLPAGFMELGETMAEGAKRETREEACAQVETDGLFTLLDIPEIGQCHLFYRARMTTPEYAPGLESAEVVLIDESDIPWRQLAFPSIFRTLELYCIDRAEGRFTVHDERLGKHDWHRMELDASPVENAI